MKKDRMKKVLFPTLALLCSTLFMSFGANQVNSAVTKLSFALHQFLLILRG